MVKEKEEWLLPTRLLLLLVHLFSTKDPGWRPQSRARTSMVRASTVCLSVLCRSSLQYNPYGIALSRPPPTVPAMALTQVKQVLSWLVVGFALGPAGPRAEPANA